MLQLDQVTLTLGKFQLRADFSIPPGAHVSIMGASGAGKSTLLGAIAGFQRPEHGRVLWDGRDLTMLAPSARPVSILFQDNNLFPHLTALQNVGLGIRPSLKLSAEERRLVLVSQEQIYFADIEQNTTKLKLTLTRPELSETIEINSRSFKASRVTAEREVVQV